MEPRTRNTEHTFHVPVMGIGFTIDTPIRLAPLGIESSISLVNDDVIEAARKYHCRKRLLPFDAIHKNDVDARARRITEYLNLVNRLVQADTEKLRRSSFSDPRGIKRYFELLPVDAPSRLSYDAALTMPPGRRKEETLDALRSLITPGIIGVNIMTKLDGSVDAKGRPLALHDSEAHAALRGFAESTVSGPLILSAGANPGLFAYLAEFPDFFPNADGLLEKKIVLKVSDFRSAHVQGRMLARRGLWVSEYRLESGLNCGGHAFPTDGQLMGPILEDFRDKRSELQEGLFPAFQKALVSRGRPAPSRAPAVRITAQGGIGTPEEHKLLRERWGVDSVGWGSPFLMVPEAVTLDPRTKKSLIEASTNDVKLSWSSPLGVRFWWLETCASEEARNSRIERGLPGSVCTARHVALNTEFSDVPLCKGSRAYQRKKKATLDPAHPDYAAQVERLEAPACICVDLCGSFLECTAPEEAPPPAICPGPNIINFQRELRLEEMVSHIYGQTNVLTRANRPHAFLRELELYLQVFDEDLATLGTSLQARSSSQLEKMLEGLSDGIAFYRKLSASLPSPERGPFELDLNRLEKAVRLRRAHEVACRSA